MGITGKMLTDYVGDARLTKYGVHFTSQVWPGDTPDASTTVDGILNVSTRNQNGTQVLSGYAGARLDP